MNSVAKIQVSDKLAINDETRHVAALLIDECWSLPYIIADCRKGIREEFARLKLCGMLGKIVCDALPPAPEAFINAAMWLCIDKINYLALADLLCEHWTPERIEQREVMEREETEERIRIMEMEREAEECERFDCCY